MTSSGMNGLNTRTNASPKRDRLGVRRSKRPLLQMFHGNLPELGNSVKNGNKVTFENKVKIK